MKVTFQDFYGQHVTVHDETASGNVRIKVRTSENLNDLRGITEENCTIETDIALDEGTLDILFGALKRMRDT